MPVSTTRGTRRVTSRTSTATQRKNAAAKKEREEQKVERKTEVIVTLPWLLHDTGRDRYGTDDRDDMKTPSDVGEEGKPFRLRNMDNGEVEVFAPCGEIVAVFKLDHLTEAVSMLSA